MKCFVVVVIVTVLALNIYGLNLRPNIQLTFNVLTDFNTLEYSIEPLVGSFSPLHVSSSYIISLRSFPMNDNDMIWWSIQFQHKNQINCNWFTDIPLDKNPNINPVCHPDSNVEDETWKGKKHKVLHSFCDNKSIPLLMEFYGCKRARKDDKIHWNQIVLVLFKNSEPTKIEVWNKSLTFYPSFLGYLQIKNIANTSNTDEQNELVFRDLILYCQYIAEIQVSRNYIPSFEKFYGNDHLQPSKTTWIFKYIPIIIIATLILLLIIFISFCSTYY